MPTNAETLELAIRDTASIGTQLPQILPNWMVNLGIIPKDTITNAQRIGSKDQTYKTDVIIHFQQSPALKISAKLSNAGYYGNWYGHKRLIKEFGHEIFQSITDQTTKWANQWINNPNANLFVGVSISFGERTGNTFIDFLEVFDGIQELKKVIAGSGEGEGVANSLYISSEIPQSLDDLLNKLKPIDQKILETKAQEIKIVFRPVNPKTEKSNRGKNVYTRFQPTKPLNNKKEIQSIEELRKLGNFVTVEPNSINHNHILDDLRDNYQIIITRKE
ncbi:hypothetical protein FRE64_16275 [Euhalothece natronophila Z-M001]|uniref:Uncharacterized protein n=1 Tax=Euhalothece natronophila Z-M001 TaxID=522448 RepID=A0A5B8NTJ5_9CHRO|nr:hypothetical protein [Euhalothece natronophila]QDZ41360.1 hypothetical protein FRE64_16275 [Euhalothece natronophila Z-M001]